MRKPLTSSNLLALMRTREACAAIEAALAGHGQVACEARVGCLGDPASRRFLGETADIVLVDLDLTDEGELAALSELTAKRPVIVTAVHATVPGLRRLLHIGIRDVLPQPLVAADVLAAVDLALKGQSGVASDSARRTSKVIPFYKACGGAGATTLATHMAVAMAAQGGRHVCLLDLDLQFGTVAMALDLDQQLGVIDLVGAQHDIDRALLRGVLQRHASGIQVLCSSAGMLPLHALTPEAVRDLLAIAAAEFDVVLVDLPAAWTEWSQPVLTTADAAVLVTRTTVPGLRHCLRQLQTIEEEGGGHLPVLLVANQHRRRLLGADPRLSGAEELLRRPLDHVIPCDEAALAHALDLGATLYDTGQGRRVRKAMDGLSAALLAVPGRERSVPAAQPSLRQVDSTMTEAQAC